MSSLTTKGPILSQTTINEELNEERSNSNFRNAQRIFDRMPSKYNDIPSNVGLVVGKIQSGKTSNIISLAAHSLDNGYRLIILLLADTLVLLNQNSQRIFKAFTGIEDVYVINESDKSQISGLTPTGLKYLYAEGKSIVLCALKHYGHIDEITNIFKDSPYADDFSLIIDDESDDVSQNTNSHRFDPYAYAFRKEGARSTTNQSIHDLKQTLTKSAYISVTASPQVNILLQTFQDLSPNYCVTIEPGEDYYDLANFHDPENNKVVEIEDFDKERFASETYIPKSLYSAFCFFVAGILVRKKRETDPFKASFLIHPSSQIIDHNKLYERLTDKIDSLQDGLDAENERGYEFLRDVRNEYSQFRDSNEIQISDVANVLHGLVGHCLNSDNDENDLQKSTEMFPYHYVVGGNMLDRGLTLPGLTVTYMTRESEVGQADTLLQRARWLGYKKNYFDLCRVYLTPHLKDQFEEMIEHYDSVWEFLSYCSDLESDMKNERVELVLNSEILKVASSSKVLVQYDRISANYTQRYFTGDRNENEENLSLLAQYESRYGDTIVYNPVQTHKVVHIKMSDLKQILSEFHISTLEDHYEYSAKNLLTLIERLNLNDDLDVDLVQMRIYDKEERSTSVNDVQRINNIFQGRSQGKISGDEGYYPGDRYIVKDNIMIQVHHVILKNDVENKYKKGDEVVMLAVLFPNSYRTRGIITRKEL